MLLCGILKSRYIDLLINSEVEATANRLHGLLASRPVLKVGVDKGERGDAGDEVFTIAVVITPHDKVGLTMSKSS